MRQFFKDDEKCPVFHLTSSFTLQIFIDDAEQQFDKKDKFNFRIYDVRTCTINNCNAHVAQYLKK